MRRVVRVVATLVITGLAVAYLLWKIDVSKTVHILTHARLGWFALALAIMAGTGWPMAWRWKQLLRARGIDDRMSWRVRADFTAATAGPRLPTSTARHAH